MAALTTTWTEKSVVAFNSGTLSTLSDCTDYVSNKLKRGTLSTTTTPTLAEVEEEIVRAKAELMEVFGFAWQRKYMYASSTANTYRYALPEDFGRLVSLRDTTNHWKLVYIPPDQFDLKYPLPTEESTTTNLNFTIKDRELWLVPPPSGTFTLELEFERTGDDTTQSDISYIPQSLRFKICDYAIYESYLSLHMWREAQMYHQKWMEGINKSRRADNKAKFHKFGFQALTWQQQYNAQYHQQ